jgi:hypothetical protein
MGNYKPNREVIRLIIDFRRGQAKCADLYIDAACLSFDIEYEHVTQKMRQHFKTLLNDYMFKYMIEALEDMLECPANAKLR